VAVAVSENGVWHIVNDVRLDQHHSSYADIHDKAREIISRAISAANDEFI